MSSADKDVQVARIAAWQAVLVAVVTAAGGGLCNSLSLRCVQTGSLPSPSVR